MGGAFATGIGVSAHMHDRTIGLGDRIPLRIEGRIICGSKHCTQGIEDFRIAVGLPLSLRQKMSYCSAADSRRSVCLKTPANGEILGDSISFSLDERQSENRLDEIDPVEQDFYLFLARATPEEKAVLLEKIDHFLFSLLQNEEEYSPELMTVAFHFVQGQANATDLEEESYIQLLSLLLSSLRKKSYNEEALDVVLQWLLSHLRRIPNRRKEAIFERVRLSQNNRFVSEILRILKEGPLSEQADGLMKAVDGSFGEKSDLIFFELLSLRPSCLPQLSAEQKKAVLYKLLTVETENRMEDINGILRSLSGADRMDVANTLLTQVQNQTAEAFLGTRQSTVLQWIFDLQIQSICSEKSDEEGAEGSLSTLSDEARFIWFSLLEKNFMLADGRAFEQGMLYLIASHYHVIPLEACAQELLSFQEKFPHAEKQLLDGIVRLSGERADALQKEMLLLSLTTEEELFAFYTSDRAIVRQPYQRELEDTILKKSKSLRPSLPPCQREGYTAYMRQRQKQLENTALSQSTKASLLENIMVGIVAQMSYEELLQLCTATEHDAADSMLWQTVQRYKDSSLPQISFLNAYHTLLFEGKTEKLVAFLRQNKGTDLLPKHLLSILLQGQRIGVSFPWELFFLAIRTRDDTGWDRQCLISLLNQTSELQNLYKESYLDATKAACCRPEWVTQEDCQLLGKALKEVKRDSSTKLLQEVRHALLKAPAAPSPALTTKEREYTKSKGFATIGTTLTSLRGFWGKK